MLTVADVLRRHGPAYLQRFGDAMPAEQQRVPRAIMACRSGELGTVPEAFRQFARSHPRSAYAAMFQASSQAIQTLAADRRRLGATKLGFFGALHTRGRDLSYHPHIHFLSPNARESLQSLAWLVAATLGLLYWLVSSVRIVAPTAAPLVCDQCGQPLLLVAFHPPATPEPDPRSRPP